MFEEAILKLPELTHAANLLQPRTGVTISEYNIDFESDQILADMKIDKISKDAVINVTAGFLAKTTLQEKMFALAKGYAEHRNEFNKAITYKNSLSRGASISFLSLMAAGEQCWAFLNMALDRSAGKIAFPQTVALLFGSSAAYVYNKKCNEEKALTFNTDSKAIEYAGSPEAAVSLLKKIDEQQKKIEESLKGKHSWYKFENFSFKDISLKDMTWTKFVHENIYKPITRPAVPTIETRIDKIEKAYNLGKQNGNDQPGLVRA